MAKSSIYLFKLFGFKVKLDPSWFFLGILVAWTLAAGYFPISFPNLDQVTYWVMGILSALGLFFSIVLHELTHSLVGHVFGIPISGITLFIFGGVAEMHDNPPSAKAEGLMAIAGPLMSLLLAFICYQLFFLGNRLLWPTPILGVVKYLSMINLVVGIFNLIPGFPLDGGRVLRAILWWWTKDLKWSTKIAAYGGVSVGILLMLFGVLEFLHGELINAIWSVLLGLFLQHIAKASYKVFLKTYHDA